MPSPEYTALSEFEPDASDDVLHEAYPEVSATVPQFAIGAEPTMNATVPVAPDVTVALRTMTVPTFWGPVGEVLSVVVVVASDGDVEAKLLVEGPTPPALDAATLNV